MLRSCRDEDRQVAVEGLGGQPVGPGGVAQPDLHLVLLRWGVAECLEPCRGARAATAGVDDEVGVEHFVGAAVGATENPHPGDAVTIGGGDESDGVAALDEPQVGEGSQPGSNVVLQEWSAGAQECQPAVCLSQPMTAEVEACVGQHVPGRGPVGNHCGGEPGEQFFECLLPTGGEGVEVAAVRDAASMPGRVGQLVPVDHGHLPVAVAERASSQQPRDAGANHDGAICDLCVHCRHLLVEETVRHAAARLPDHELSSRAQCGSP